MNRPAKTICLSVIGFLLAAAAFAGGKLTVSNYGTDSLTCGPPDNPCRSISQAIENAGDRFAAVIIEDVKLLADGDGSGKGGRHGEAGAGERNCARHIQLIVAVQTRVRARELYRQVSRGAETDIPAVQNANVAAGRNDSIGGDGANRA